MTLYLYKCICICIITSNVLPINFHVITFSSIFGLSSMQGNINWSGIYLVVVLLVVTVEWNELSKHSLQCRTSMAITSQNKCHLATIGHKRVYVHRKGNSLLKLVVHIYLYDWCIWWTNCSLPLSLSLSLSFFSFAEVLFYCFLFEVVIVVVVIVVIALSLIATNIVFRKSDRRMWCAMYLLSGYNTVNTNGR